MSDAEAADETVRDPPPREPTLDDLRDPLFLAMCGVVSRWDVRAPWHAGYCSATGTHALVLADAARAGLTSSLLREVAERADRAAAMLLVDSTLVIGALEWYAEQAELCRKIGSAGDAGRQALDADGGRRAREALAALRRDAP